VADVLPFFVVLLGTVLLSLVRGASPGLPAWRRCRGAPLGGPR
jgi:hypothetical protein